MKQPLAAPTEAELRRARADAEQLGMPLEELVEHARDLECPLDRAADALFAHRGLVARRAAGDESPAIGSYVDEAARFLAVTVEEIELVATEWRCTPQRAAELLVEARQQRDAPRPAVRSRSKRPLSAAERELEAMQEPSRIEADAKAVVDAARAGTTSDVARQTALDRDLPMRMRGGAHGAPPMSSYRSMVVRRHGDLPHAPLWFYRAGAVPVQVKAWLREGAKSPNPVERALVGALLCERNRVGWRAVFPIAALAHYLFWDARKTVQPGYSAIVEGVRRSDIARRSAHYFVGQPLDPDTISRYLLRLGELLGSKRTRRRGACVGGLLEWEQVRPSQAVKHRLHKSRHYLADGSVRVQATNIYRWRDAEWVARNKADHTALKAAFQGSLRDGNADASAPGSVAALNGNSGGLAAGGSALDRVDPNTGYEHKHTDKGDRLDLEGLSGKESPAATSIRPPVPAASVREARARDGPLDAEGERRTHGGLSREGFDP